jgi:glycyl-tRNA synthetase beta chain
MDFLKGRLSHLLEENGISKDIVSAILAVPIKNIVDAWKRAHALQQLKFMPDFETLAIAFKRVVNIIKKSNPGDIGVHGVDESIFEHPSESALYEKFKIVKQTVSHLLNEGDINSSFKEIALLRPPVDQFFTDVMVMAENLDLRKNRLALLGEISNLFEMLADFSKITT